MLRLLRSAKARREELLSAYLDDRLGSKDRARVARLLDSSGEARAELESLRVTVALLRQAPVARTSRSFRLTPEMVSAERQDAAWGWQRFALPVAAGAAVLFLTFSLAGGATDLFSRERAPAVDRQARLEAVEAPVATTPPAAAATRQVPPPIAAPIPRGAEQGRQNAVEGPQGRAASAEADAQTSMAISSATEAEGATEAEIVEAESPAGPDRSAAAEVERERFPWLVLQLVSGGLTGAALITILWHYRRSRSRTREMG